MEKWNLLTVCCILVTLITVTPAQLDDGSIHSVTITDVRGALVRDDMCVLGDYIELTINIPQIEPITLKLSKNTKAGINKDIHVMKISNVAEFTLLKNDMVPDIENFELYQDVVFQASIGVECLVTNSAPPTILFTGSFHFLGKIVTLRPPGEQQGYEVIAQEEQSVGNDYRHAPSDKGAFPMKVKREVRSRRQVDITQPFVVDVLVVVDFSVYLHWYTMSTGSTINQKVTNTKNNIRRYFAHIINGADLRYKLIPEADLKISIQLAGYIIAESPDVYAASELAKESGNPKALLNADKALKDFRTWIKSTRNVPRHDYAMLFTGYDLYTEVGGLKNNATSGLAYISTLCRTNGDSVSVVEEHGGFQSISVTAHEIGHGLGAVHDGENNQCSSGDRYIMAGFGYGTVPVDKRLHQWHFSPCSTAYFRDFIEKSVSNGATCLTESISAPGIPDVSSEIPGQTYSPDEQCRMIWGQNSYYCRGKEFGNASTICTSMYCRDPNSVNECVLHTAVRGTTCGNKQWCIDGKCALSALAPEKPENCVHGNDPGIAFEGLTCSQLVAKSSSYCYQEVVRARCCQSCRLAFTGIRDCEYGNRALGCTQGHCLAQEFLARCCGTCNYGFRIDSTTPPSLPSMPSGTTLISPTPPQGGDCRDSVTINGQSCSDFINKYGGHICYQGSMSQFCCATCLSNKETITGCPYGNRIPSKCVPVNKANATWCDVNKYDCCSTCAELCQDGVCTDPPGNESSPESCFNTDLYLFNGKPCDSFVRDEPYRCYDDMVRGNCCISCQNALTGKQGCEYGDRSGSCDADICNLVSPGSSYAQSCCATCGEEIIPPEESTTTTTTLASSTTTATPAPPITVQTTTIRGQDDCRDDQIYVFFGSIRQCSTLPTTPYYCYLDYVRTSCCQTCRTLYMGIDGCEYGDRTDGCDIQTCNLLSPTSNYVQSCCATCGEEIIPLEESTTTTTTLSSSTTTATPAPSITVQTTTTRGQDDCRDDQIYVFFGSIRQCSTLPTTPYYCYLDYVRTSCCQTCRTLYMGIDGCEYGDRTDDCDIQTCNLLSPTSNYVQSCCATCGGVTTKREETTTSQTIVSVTTGDTTGVCVDSPKYRVGGKSCSRIITETPFYCYTDTIRSNCCRSCGNIWNATEGCEYGDRTVDCRKASCTHSLGYREMCCRTCASETSARPSTISPTPRQTTVMSDSCLDTAGFTYVGKTCSQIASDLPHSCYWGDVIKNCCGSCKRISSNVDGCEYGDRIVGCRPEYCRTSMSGCCSTCSNILTTPVHSVRNTTTPPTVATTTTPKKCKDLAIFGGQTCTEFILSRGLYVCDESYLAERCCAACQTYNLCPDGDVTPAKCVPQAEANATWCWEYQDHCCYTCALWAMANEIIWPLEDPRFSKCYADSMDTPGVVFDGMTCAAMAIASPRLCYQIPVRNKCCKSCNDVHTGIAGCEYGDRTLECLPGMCALFSNSTEYHFECCQTCSSRITTDSVSTEVTITTTPSRGPSTDVWCFDEATIDDLTCEQFVSQYGIRHCYEQFFETRCCQTCLGLRVGHAHGCEYGNRLTDCITTQQANATWCYQNGDQCCATCWEISGSNTIQLPVSFIVLLWFTYLLI
ncbi:hypothetical protein ScPMuIL_016462 [Solemya velum]